MRRIGRVLCREVVDADQRSSLKKRCVLFRGSGVEMEFLQFGALFAVISSKPFYHFSRHSTWARAKERFKDEVQIVVSGNRGDAGQ